MEKREKQKSVLFVCYGNICRSPMAEALFREMVKKNSRSLSWRIDSAGFVDWNEGSKPDVGTLTVLSENSIPVGEHRARKMEKKDFYEFDFIFSMDEFVTEKLLVQTPHDSKAKVEPLRRYDPEQQIFEDPYGGTKADFEKVFRQSIVCLKHFLEKISGDPDS